MTERPLITCSLTISRVPAHWLHRVRFPNIHLQAACDREGAVLVLPGAVSRRLYQPHLLVCQECQRLLDKYLDGLRSQHDLFD